MSVSDASFGSDRLTRKSGSSQSSWWEVYARSLAESGLTSTSIEVIDADSEFVIQRGIFGAGPPAAETWPNSRTRSGVVMGAVQSGKTASMLAVIAKALDGGIDAVVVLAGTRTALWQQTLSRLISQLDAHPDPWKRRILVPNRALVGSESPAADLSAIYSVPRPLASRALREKIPLVAVVMKNVHHLEKMAATLHKHVYSTAGSRDEPFHLLVVDDEADDSSILDAVAEARAGLTTAESKQIPRRIADLWERRAQPGETAQQNLFATYVAYTATPQANFLQDLSNPLAPRDFAVSLRTPGASGSVEDRSATYADPAGLRSWYTGGQIFYDKLATVPLCRTSDSDEDVLGAALRSFFVASAIRLWREGSALGPAASEGCLFDSREEATAGTSSVSSMLIHPSSAKEDHFDVAARVLSWTDGIDVDTARTRIARGDRSLSAEKLRERICQELPLWQDWLREYIESANRVYVDLHLPQRPLVPSITEWNEIYRLVIDEIVPGTRLAVINSDDLADPKPDFEVRAEDGRWRAPRNHSTIFVSGNVMARGLTLEGLSTTLFTRRADAPLADTQMQMQRWFGYRGKIIDLCRVFLTPEQLDLFRAYHEADEALRRDILHLMDHPGGVARAVTVLQGQHFTATGKIANVGRRDIWPGPLPFVRRVNKPRDDVSNAGLLAELFAEDAEVVRSNSGTREMGLIMRDDLSLERVAEILDLVSLPTRSDGDLERDSRHWASLERHLGLTPDDELVPLYRGTLTSPPGSASAALAAYLRTWAACLTRSAPGLITTSAPSGPWNLLDLEAARRTQPRFRVGLRFGRGPVISEGPLANAGLEVRAMDRDPDEDGFLKSSWGSRGATGEISETGTSRRAGYPGDECFDYFARGEGIPMRGATSARPAGEPGLLLFHPIAFRDGGASFTLGMSIPLGGPDQGAAMLGDGQYE